MTQTEVQCKFLLGKTIVLEQSGNTKIKIAKREKREKHKRLETAKTI
jgi:hypothetical protein